jgi:hypothetical protein
MVEIISSISKMMISGQNDEVSDASASLSTGDTGDDPSINSGRQCRRQTKNYNQPLTKAVIENVCCGQKHLHIFITCPAKGVDLHISTFLT